MFKSALAHHAVVHGVVPGLLLLAPRAAPMDGLHVWIPAGSRVPGMPGGVSPNILLTPLARIPSSLGRGTASHIAVPSLSAGCRVGGNAAGRAPSGTATGELTTQASTKIDNALDKALTEFPRPNLRVMTVTTIDVDMHVPTGTSKTNKLCQYLRRV